MQIFLKVLIIIVLGGGMALTWYGVTPATSLEIHTQAVASAARLAVSPEAEFATRLDIFRKHLAVADPDTSRYPQTWAALSALVEQRDRGQVEKTTKLSVSATPILPVEPLLVACEREALAVQAEEKAAMHQRLLVMSGCFWGIVTIIGLGLWGYRQQLIQQLGKYSVSRPRSLSEALSNLIENFESLQRDVQVRERQALDLALMQRRIKMSSSGGFEPVKTPLPSLPPNKSESVKSGSFEPVPTPFPAQKPEMGNPVPPPPSPSSLETIKTSPPASEPPPFPEPYFPLAHSQSSESLKASSGSSSIPVFTLSTDVGPTAPPPNPPPPELLSDTESVKYARLADSIGGFILGDTTDPAMVPRIPIGSGQFSRLDHLQRQNGMLVSITLQDVELFQHIYIKPEVVLEAALQNIVNLLLRCRVRPAEIAIEYDTVYWYIPAEVDISPSEIEAFLLNAYRDSVFVFGDRQLELPEISITVPPRGSFFGIH